jgi:hypothetical protein
MYHIIKVSEIRSFCKVSRYEVYKNNTLVNFFNTRTEAEEYIKMSEEMSNKNKKRRVL